MAFLDHVLQPPSYGWQDERGVFIKPTPAQIVFEFFSRLNLFKSKKNWLPVLAWTRVLCLLPFLLVFLFGYFNGWLLLCGFVYGMIVMGTHGTIWYHRYGTHAAYQFRNKFWRFFTRNLALAIIPEEIYVVSHHVHHVKSDTPGDPYFAQGGFLYCFLADVNHQPIAKDLSERDYQRVLTLMRHTGVVQNSYQQYQKWGSVASPLHTIIHWVLNWAFWYAAFYLIGGHGLACACFGGAFIWAVGVRTFNYEGHGKGKDMRQDGTDYNRDDMSVNQIWPGFVAGEWHNNHHLYPKSARSGFLNYQVDLAWYYIKLLNTLGAVTSYHDSKAEFIKKYHDPYIESKKVKKESLAQGQAVDI